MKKQLINVALSFAFLSPFLGFGQLGRIQPCNTYAAMEEHFANDPAAKVNYEKAQAKMEKEYQDLLITKNTLQGKAAAVQYTIPVVFHILHQGGTENITDAQCIAALNQVNIDYAAAGSDFSTIFAPFQSLYVNSDIKFMLAHKDPQGNCTTGIEHIMDSRTTWSQTAVSTNYTGLTWNPTKYLNIFIVKEIISSSPVVGGGIIVGYTYKPGTWPSGANQDAIVYNHGFLGGLDARSLSHEIGHWFNLTHTFGNTNNPGVQCGSVSGGDGVSDTPDTKGNFGQCPASSTNSNIVCTGVSGSTPYYQNVENIMDYSNCPKNFTQGQTTKMHAALNSATSGRNNLWSANNLVVTDVNIAIPCSEFISSTNLYTVCSGGSLTMQDLSAGTISTYQWSADNGAIIASPTSTSTSITFPTAGVSNVTLTVSNGQGSGVKVKTVTVVNGVATINGPYTESFEGSGTPQDWQVINEPPTSAGWSQTNGAAFDGVNSFFVDGSQEQANEVEILQMPIMNTLNYPNDSVKFSYAYARQSSNQNDILKVQASTNCGASWNDIVTFSASQMAANSGGILTGAPFYPILSQWKTYNLSAHPNWSNYQASQSLLIRYFFQEGTTGGGNNFFIDAMTVGGGSHVGMNELTKSISLNLYPNPTNGAANINFNLSDASAIKINVVDVLGKNVLPEINSNLSAGQQNFTINKDNTLPKGIYFVNLSLNGAKMSSKLIIN